MTYHLPYPHSPDNTIDTEFQSTRAALQCSKTSRDSSPPYHGLQSSSTSVPPPILSPVPRHVLPFHLAPSFQGYDHAGAVVLRVQVFGEFQNGLCGFGGVFGAAREIAYLLVGDERGQAVCYEDETGKVVACKSA